MTGRSLVAAALGRIAAAREARLASFNPFTPRACAVCGASIRSDNQSGACRACQRSRRKRLGSAATSPGDRRGSLYERDGP